MQSLNERSGATVIISGRPEKIVEWMNTLIGRLIIKMESLQTIGGKRKEIMIKPLKLMVCQTEIMVELVEISRTPQEIGAKLQ